MGQEALAQSATLMVSETYPAHATPMNNEDGAVDELEKMFKKAEGQNQDTSIDNNFSSKDHDADLIIDDQNPDDQFEDDLAKVTWMQKSSGSHQAEHIHASKSASIDARPISAPLERSSIWGVEMDSATAGGNNDGKNETHSIFGESTLSAVATQGGIAHGKSKAQSDLSSELESSDSLPPGGSAHTPSNKTLNFAENIDEMWLSTAQLQAERGVLEPSVVDAVDQLKLAQDQLSSLMFAYGVPASDKVVAGNFMLDACLLICCFCSRQKNTKGSLMILVLQNTETKRSDAEPMLQLLWSQRSLYQCQVRQQRLCEDQSRLVQ